MNTKQEIIQELKQLSDYELQKTINKNKSNYRKYLANIIKQKRAFYPEVRTFYKLSRRIKRLQKQNKPIPEFLIYRRDDAQIYLKRWMHFYYILNSESICKKNKEYYDKFKKAKIDHRQKPYRKDRLNEKHSKRLIQRGCS